MRRKREIFLNRCNYKKVLGFIGIFLVIAMILNLYGAKASEAQKAQIRKNETRQVKELQGRIDSIRDDKIVISYEPEGQPGSWIQVYFLRNQDTKFLRRAENKIKPGDAVNVTYEEARWVDEEEKHKVERIAKTVSFVRDKALEEKRRVDLEKKRLQEGLQGPMSTEGDQ
jgi:hypothetical protein